MAGRPYLYHHPVALAKSHKLCMAIIRKELDKAGFELGSKPVYWEQFAYNADTLVLVIAVPMSASKTYVDVSATSNVQASAKKWAADLFDAIKNSKMTLLD
jgi:hypothetical protein